MKPSEERDKKKEKKGKQIKCPLENKWYGETDFLFQVQTGYNICLKCGVVFYPPRSLKILKEGVEQNKKKEESNIIVVKDSLLETGFAKS
jgi:hypothetical protein